jgi:predicted nucleic acid-binding protein
VVGDDLMTRRKTVVGTAGVLLLAEKDGLIAEVRPLLDCLIESDFRISTAVCDTVLRTAGEA